MVYLLTQEPVVVTTTRIFAVNGMRGHLPGSQVGQVRPRTRLQRKLTLRLKLRAWARRRVRVALGELLHVSLPIT